MFRRLRNRFLILNMAVTSLVMLSAFVAVYMTTAGNIQTENERKLDNVDSFFVATESIVELPPHALPDNAAGAIQVSGAFSKKVTSDYVPSFVLRIDKNGNLLSVDSLVDLPSDVYSQAAEIAWNRESAAAVTLADRLWIYRPSEVSITHVRGGQEVQEIQMESAGYSQIFFLDITDSQKTLGDLALTFLLVGVGMLAVIFIVSFFFANRSIQPIAVSWERQRQFVADASHELKTPLTTIMTNCDVLEANEGETIKSQAEWLGYIRAGTDRMSKLVNSLLTLARVDGMSARVEKESFDVDALIHDVLRSMETHILAKKLRIEQRVEGVGDVYGYADSVRQVFSILLDNAVKYVDEGGRIILSARRVKRGVQCTVKNTGNGIPDKDLPRIFDRFYRSDRARSGDDNSYGLGLSIAKSILEQMGGKITARSTENKWTEFTFAFEA